MSLEVHEISIGMNLLSRTPQGAGTSHGPENPSEPGHNDALVQKCVQLVLQALQRARER